MDFQYRAAALEDLETLTRLRLEMRRERDGSFPEEPLREATLDFYRRTLAGGSHAAFLCERDGEAVGAAGLSFYEMPPTAGLLNGRMARFMNMYIRPAWRKQGAARGLLAFAVAWAAERGCSKVVLHSSPMGRGLYEHFGFEKVSDEYQYLTGR